MAGASSFEDGGLTSSSDVASSSVHWNNTECSITDSNLVDCTLDNFTLLGCTVEKCLLISCKLMKCTLANCSLNRCTITKSTIKGSTLEMCCNTLDVGGLLLKCGKVVKKWRPIMKSNIDQAKTERTTRPALVSQPFKSVGFNSKVITIGASKSANGRHSLRAQPSVTGILKKTPAHLCQGCREYSNIQTQSGEGLSRMKDLDLPPLLDYSTADNFITDDNGSIKQVGSQLNDVDKNGLDMETVNFDLRHNYRNKQSPGKSKPIHFESLTPDKNHHGILLPIRNLMHLLRKSSHLNYGKSLFNPKCNVESSKKSYCQLVNEERSRSNKFWVYSVKIASSVNDCNLLLSQTMLVMQTNSLIRQTEKLIKETAMLTAQTEQLNKLASLEDGKTWSFWTKLSLWSGCSCLLAAVLIAPCILELYLSK